MRSTKPSPRWAPGANPWGVNRDATLLQAPVMTVKIQFHEKFNFFYDDIINSSHFHEKKKISPVNLPFNALAIK